MLRRLIAGVATVAALAGCGSGDGSLPAECTNGADAVLAALHRAPEPVTIDGTPLSECLSGAPDGEQVQLVGTAFVEAAVELAGDARTEPESRSALELGYLVAAANRGGSNQGVHAELLRRLDQEAAGIDRSSSAYRRGQRAGESGG